MKKQIYLMTLAPIIAIILYLIFGDKEGGSIGGNNHAGINFKSDVGASNQILKDKHINLVQSGTDEIAKIKAKRLEGYNKNSEAMKSIEPEIYERYKKGFAKKKESQIRDFFQGLDIENSKIDKAVKLILNRDIDVLAEHFNSVINRPKEVGDLSDAKQEAASYKRAVAKQDSVRTIFDQEMTILLGNSKLLRDFQEFETKLNASLRNVD